ncbi:F-box only protein 6 [Diabrotica virgifera virgifera]|uniref:F-box only protein 6-like n=1 Tax=Diabrotica virgifera virgifera TaxID=50390 RepID=A0A6P7H786_DIAVI|nr:F-box only protein 6 [Diabrotica virgifera virgifera]
MGSLKSKLFDTMEISDAKEAKIPKLYVPVEEFQFHGPLEDDTSNGLFLNDVYFPEEIIIKILTFLPPEQLLPLSLVCKKWCNIIKSDSFWMDVYNNQFPNKAKRLPWYVYYLYYSTDDFRNLLKNGNGQEGFKHWTILKNFGDEFIIEPVPKGSDPLPEGVPEFCGRKSCFTTSFYECCKIQVIRLENKRLLRYVINKFKPHIYVSEWYAGRFDCGCEYKLTIKGLASESMQKPMEDEDLEIEYDRMEYHRTEGDEIVLFSLLKPAIIPQWEGKEWNKMEITVDEYESKTLKTLVFQHEGVDTQFWKGHYGSKMAGGVVKFLFESIQPIEEHIEEPCD